MERLVQLVIDDGADDEIVSALATCLYTALQDHFANKLYPIDPTDEYDSQKILNLKYS